METIGKFFTTVVLIILSTLYSGYVLSKMWIWLIVPIYHVNPINVIGAIATMSIVQFFLLGITMNQERNIPEGEKFIPYLITKFLTLMMTYSIALLMAYIYSLFI